MDAVKDEVRKAAAAPADGVPRRPLVPSEKGNAAAPAGRRREAACRFKPVALPAALAARRCTSPSPGRASAVDGSAPCNRARSADRERPAASSAAPSSLLKPSTTATASSVTPARNAAAEAHGTPPRATSAKAPDGFWTSVRSSSPSLRSESVPAPAKKIDRLVRGLPSEMAKVKVQAGAAAERKRSPLRGNTNNVGDQCENARPSEAPAKRVVEQHRWPAMMTGWGSAGSLTLGSITRAADKASIASSSSNPSGRSSKRVHPSEGTGKCLNRPSNEMAKRAAIHRSRREDKTDSGSDASSQTSENSKSACRSSRAISSPVPILHRSSSPSKVSSAASSTSVSYQSPSRMRPSAPCRSKCASATQSCAAPVFNYIVDTRKGKKNAGQIENIHQLRLLHNTYLQWRFVNAHSEATLSFRENSVESILYSVWKSIVTLRDALTITRIDVRLLQQELKLYYILTEQITYLEQWPVLEEENSSTLVEAIEALKASTMRLPVTSRAQVDAVAVKNTISSAVDVMQALSSSICYLQSKVEDRTSLVSELSVMARQEKLALDECRELLASAAKMQVQEASLRTHLMQLREGVAG